MAGRNWVEEASNIIAAMETEVSTDAGRKGFYRGDGMVRVDGMRGVLSALLNRVEKLVRHI